MMRVMALLWMGIVLLGSVYLCVRVSHGLNFRTDLMALLPQEQQNPELKRANDIATRALSRHVVFLIGDKDRNTARAAAKMAVKKLNSSGLFDISTDAFDKRQLEQLGKLYYPYREGLLSNNDRKLLANDQAQAVADRALSQIYGVISFANSKLLRGDPFLLMPDFLASLPLPLSRLNVDEGMLSLQDEGRNWVLIAGQVRGEPFALDIQKKVSSVLNDITDLERASDPNLRVLRLGAVFFAKAGAEEAMGETTSIGVISTAGTILLIIYMFRAVRPLFLSLLVIAVGVVCALAFSLWAFGELHVVSLLFGVTLIGVSVDYSLQYCSEIFSPNVGLAEERLKRVLIGITIGTATTIIGYLTLYLAPFPGLHQIAAFSAVGLFASWLTVVLWLPLLDCNAKASHGQSMLSLAALFLTFWEKPKYRTMRRGIFATLFILALLGGFSFRTDDNVRHMQSLSASLVAEQEEIQRLIGKIGGSQFFIVQAPDNETALQREELLANKLAPLVDANALTGFQSVAQYIPSEKRQKENQLLQDKYLYKPLLGQQTKRLGLISAPEMPEMKNSFLTIEDVKKLNRPPAFLSALLLGEDGPGITHMVSLDGVQRPEIVAQAAEGLEGVRFVDPAGDFGTLLGKYRKRAVLLVAISAVFMIPVLTWRYGFRKGLWVMAPSTLAVITTPALRSLMGGAFTFFDAMALVLILSIGVDYAVFCAETSEERKSVTILAVTLAACTALLSFGLLALSKVTAVHNFGATMTLGILLSFLFAPMARQPANFCIGKRFQNVLSVVLVLILCACATPSVKPVSEKSLDTVMITPDVKLSMPSADDLNRTEEVTQLVTAHYGDQTFAFEAHISASPKRFFLVGLDLMGRKLITLDWTKNNIKYETAPWVPPQLQPENILADIVLLYWPENIVRKSLASSKASLVTHEGTRIVMLGDKTVWEATYQSTQKNDPWSGQLNYRNLVWNYDFSVQSEEQLP